MIAPDAKPIAHRPPYKPVDVSGRKPIEPIAPVPNSYEAWLCHFQKVQKEIDDCFGIVPHMMLISGIKRSEP